MKYLKDLDAQVRRAQRLKRQAEVERARRERRIVRQLLRDRGCPDLLAKRLVDRFNATKAAVLWGVIRQQGWDAHSHSDLPAKIDAAQVIYSTLTDKEKNTLVWGGVDKETS